MTNHPNTATTRNGVCLVALSTGISGTERVLADLARTIAAGKNGVQAPVSLLLGDQPSFKPFAEPFRAQGSAVAYFGDVRDRRRFWRNFATSLRFFRQQRPRLAHFHCPFYRWGLEVIWAACLARVPHLVRTEHNPLMGPPAGVWKPLLQRTDRAMTTFTYVSQGNADRYERFLGYRVGRGHVIPNGIDADRFQPTTDPESRRRVREELGFPADSRIALGIVSDFGDRRSPEPILRAFHALLQNADTRTLAAQWRLLLLGPAGEKGAALATELAMSQYVRFVARRDDMPFLLPQCDLMVSAAHYEGMSIAMMEALACGLDLLTTEVDGVVDILGDAAHAVLVPQGDAEAFVASWARLLRAHDAGAPLLQPQGGRTVRQQFTTDAMIDRYLETVYRPLLG